MNYKEELEFIKREGFSKEEKQTRLRILLNKINNSIEHHEDKREIADEMDDTDAYYRQVRILEELEDVKNIVESMIR